MADLTGTSYGAAATTSYTTDGGYRLTRTVTIPTASITATLHNIMDIPAKTVIKSAWFKVVQAPSGPSVCTVALGDGDTADGWITASSVLTAGALYGFPERGTFRNKSYSSADDLDATIAVTGTPTSPLVITVYADCDGFGA